MENARTHKTSAFSAVIIPTSIENLAATNGTDYIRMPNATVRQQGKNDQIRTILAFGDDKQNIQHLLHVGQPVQLHVKPWMRALTVVGTENEMPAFEVTVEAISAILTLNDVPQSEHDIIIHDMISVGSERPADENEVFDDFSEREAAVMKSFGYIMNPLLNAGIDFQSSAKITDLILETHAGQALKDIHSDLECLNPLTR